MAIFYPDLSHYDLQRGVKVEAGTVAVVGKATHGTLFVDSGYATIKAQAAQVGAVFGAYHWLNHGSGSAQAAYCWQQIGRVPVMVDAEDTSANSGYNGPLTVQDIVDFVTKLRALGGICSLVYLPRWYWANTMGSPDLTPLKNLGAGLVSSNYTTYSDSGPGWASYGGMAPVCWQYTDNLPYGGGTSDFNAFKGSIDQFRALLMGGTEMAQLDRIETMVKYLVEGDNTLQADGVTHTPIKTPAGEYCAAGNAVKQELDDIKKAAGTPAAATVTLTDAQLQAVINGVATKLTGLMPTPAQIAAAAADEEAKRLSNG